MSERAKKKGHKIPPPPHGAVRTKEDERIYVAVVDGRKHYYMHFKTVGWREVCGARKRNKDADGKVRRCTLWAGWGTSHPGSGLCKLHGGASSVTSTSGPNHPAFRSGLYCKRFDVLPYWQDDPEGLQALMEDVDRMDLENCDPEIRAMVVSAATYLKIGNLPAFFDAAERIVKMKKVRIDVKQAGKLITPQELMDRLYYFAMALLNLAMRILGKESREWRKLRKGAAKLFDEHLGISEALKAAEDEETKGPSFALPIPAGFERDGQGGE